MNFFNEPHDVQVILGLTLVGIPDSWDEMTLVGFVKSYSYAFGPNEVGIVSTFLEKQGKEIRQAHITCNNLYSKQKLLKIRLIPVIDGSDEKRCHIITIRPYVFWIKLGASSGPVPYMLPKYGTQDISHESIEAKLLLHKNNIHPSIVTCLMESNLIPKDGSFWNAADAILVWFTVKEQDPKLFNSLEENLAKVQERASTFEPYPYQIEDELLYSANWNQLLVTLNTPNESRTMWPWENFTNLPISPSELSRTRQGKRLITRKIGCIRYEFSRKRWVVDLSYDGKRLQKCFHETFYGLEGGLYEALKWRFEFLINSNARLSSQSELRTLSDIFDKIMQLKIAYYKKRKLIEVLKRPIEGYESICTHDRVLKLIQDKIVEFNVENEKTAESSAESDTGSKVMEEHQIHEETFRKHERPKKKTWDTAVT